MYMYVDYIQSLSNIVTIAVWNFPGMKSAGNEVASITRLKLSFPSSDVSSIILTQNLALVSCFAKVTMTVSES